MNSKLVLIVAGEASGDLHGASLVGAMVKREPGIRFYGIGGVNLKTAGVDLWADAADMAVVGLTEVASKLRGILTVMHRLKKSMQLLKPDLVILIDYPDFNLPLARSAKKNGIPVFYYISPQVWAWRKGRLRTISGLVDRMAVILPFEEPLYRQAGVDVSFVGHPLLDVVQATSSRDETLRMFGLREDVTTVALLPGSRKGEVTRLLPVMLKAARILTENICPVQFLLPMANTLDETWMKDQIAKADPPGVRLIRGATYDAVAAADAAVVVSGTATLETALLGTPLIVIYKVSALSYLIGRMLISVDHIGLVNIVAGKTVAPELIQGAANPERIAAEILAILGQPDRRKAIQEELSHLRDKLGLPGAAERAAVMALTLIKKSDC
ncbi:lipid-A-disaccharide synthase [Syntrophus aciditrophicus]|uniref:Lipid-A-disaccharide synthase n=1 Tax=Syntrophus aciditrophicus (strain SB) TaxID=56780 RepID=LPXB_SYNAS|nr:lipid-A-disaccharide synthase [Syntrophus aciditrophicus]Q2LVL8.1 RecName: Full=Lipid-A-disaccharide synthase [Syntrophus aciditrophicus SB]ABC78124.1 lipid-A-disaccharide synthase [Syntrophus aciditrophicus SB]